MSIKIIIDSGTDLPLEILKEYDIEVLPLSVYIDGQEFLDGVNITTKDVYEAMRREKILKTAQVSPLTFKNSFMKHGESGDSCIYIALSAALSGTYQTGILMRNEVLKSFPNLDIEIIDSKSGSTSSGIIAYEAAKMAREGKSVEAIIEMIKFQADHVELIFTIDKLKYLYQGGRISKTSAVIGEVLNIKPILNVVDGRIEALEKVRGRNKALKRMVEIMEERGNTLKNQIIGISHADDLDSALELKTMIEEKFGCKDFMLNLIGSVLGVHLGIGGVGVFFLNQPAK